MSEHIVKSYEEELKVLDAKIAQMGGLAEHVVAKSFEALDRRDIRLAEQVITTDKQIDALQKTIEEQVISMIARRQPVADDLRVIVSSLRVTNDLERIGDLAKNIAKRALAISSESHPKPLMTGMKHIGEMALFQLKTVLDAYSERNVEKALVVWRSDVGIDALYDSLFRELLTHMMEDPRNIGLSTHLLFGAKNAERIGDHSTNIAETISYMVTGSVVTDDRPKVDETSSASFSGT